MIDKVRNPWRKRKGVVVFDIETDRSDDWSTEGKKNRFFKCGVAYVYDEKKYYEYRKPREFVQLLNGAKTIVSFNGEGFDCLVLEKYGLEIKKYGTRWKPQKAESLDILHYIDRYRPGRHKDKKYPKLEELMFQHYGIKKSEYDPDNVRDLLRHCREDVEYTKRLYEEPIWLVPVVKRVKKERRWENYYDDDMGVVWDGETLTHVRDFGMPIKRNINVEATMLCPRCKAKRLPLLRVARGKDSTIVCSKCGAVITFSPANEILSVQSKKEYESSICGNCGKRISASGYPHFGYGAGYGYLSYGRSVCPACSKGCYEWRDDDTPGFREHWKGRCCCCGKNIDEWNQRSKAKDRKTH